MNNYRITRHKINSMVFSVGDGLYALVLYLKDNKGKYEFWVLTATAGFLDVWLSCAHRKTEGSYKTQEEFLYAIEGTLNKYINKGVITFPYMGRVMTRDQIYALKRQNRGR